MPPRTATLTPAALEALRAATVTATSVTLSGGQLDRKTYEEVNKALTRLGGKWNRKAGAHVFTTDPGPAIEGMVGTGVMVRDADKDAGYWRTPPAVAAQVVQLAGLRNVGVKRVLEPSAGDGALASAACNVHPSRDLNLVCVEPDPGRAAALRDAAYGAVHEETFEHYYLGHPEPFDAIVMNPPFALSRRPVAWAEHILLAWTLLKPGATLCAVAPASMHRRHRIVDELRDLVDQHGHVTDLPEDSFRMSGTSVNTILVTLTRED